MESIILGTSPFHPCEPPVYTNFGSSFICSLLFRYTVAEMVSSEPILKILDWSSPLLTTNIMHPHIHAHGDRF
jgi:hypothetical protein